MIPERWTGGRWGAMDGAPRARRPSPPAASVSARPARRQEGRKKKKKKNHRHVQLSCPREAGGGHEGHLGAAHGWDLGAAPCPKRRNARVPRARQAPRPMSSPAEPEQPNQLPRGARAAQSTPWRDVSPRPGGAALKLPPRPPFSRRPFPRAATPRAGRLRRLAGGGRGGGGAHTHLGRRIQGSK